MGASVEQVCGLYVRPVTRDVGRAFVARHDSRHRAHVGLRWEVRPRARSCGVEWTGQRWVAAPRDDADSCESEGGMMSRDEQAAESAA